MTKKRPDFDKVANELHGKSAFFQRATPQPDADSAPLTEKVAPSPPLSTQVPLVTDQPTPSIEPVRPVRPVRRQMIRHPFELYMDQLDRLRDLSLLQRQRGESGSMSKMVRDAIDRLLDEQVD